MWLLFAALLLIPVSWFYTESLRTVAVTYRVAQKVPQIKKPYGVLATLLQSHPFAKKFSVNWVAADDLIILDYDRRCRTLIQVFGYSSGGSHYQERWVEVSDQAIYAVANADSCSVLQTNFGCIQLFDNNLKSQGARPAANF